MKDGGVYLKIILVDLTETVPFIIIAATIVTDDMSKFYFIKFIIKHNYTVILILSMCKIR